jgi:hypothetical protein
MAKKTTTGGAPPEGKTRAKKPRARKDSGDKRDLIDAAALIDALEQHVLGRKEMTATQVSAALALLKKTLPDMSEPARRIVAEAEAMHTQYRGHEEALKDLE